MTLEVKSFADCTTQDLFDFYHLRASVFVVEQNCAYLDVDHKDLEALHILLREGDKLCAYCRLLPPGLAYAETAIGRVVVDAGERGKGYAKTLMLATIQEAFVRYGPIPIVISAQQYLEKFYADLHFVTEGAPYLEDNIPHVKMRLRRSEA
jgi:ElaA protein